MAVKRVGRPNTETHSLGHLRVYRDDLEKIISTLSEVGLLEARCDDYVFTESSDLHEIPEKVSRATFSAKGGNDCELTVALASDNATITITNPNTVALGVLAHVQKIASPRKLRLPIGPLGEQLLFRIIFGCLLVVPIFVIPPLAIIHSVSPHHWPTWVMPTGLAAILLAALILYVRVRVTTSGATIINAYYADRPPFFKRTSDHWIIMIVGALVGGVLGYIVGKLP